MHRGMHPLMFKHLPAERKIVRHKCIAPFHPAGRLPPFGRIIGIRFYGYNLSPLFLGTPTININDLGPK
jgi:hypothetical protein